jgi:hypothetical protein
MKTNRFNTPQTSRIVATVLSVWISVALLSGVDSAMIATEQSALQQVSALQGPAPVQQLDTVVVTGKRVQTRV